jgi:glycosyltransferase involved in cell wall biosynthesis
LGLLGCCARNILIGDFSWWVERTWATRRRFPKRNSCPSVVEARSNGSVIAAISQPFCKQPTSSACRLIAKSLLEAAAVGRAMIAADVPGCREVVRDGITGLLVPPRDFASLADAMRRLGEDPALRGRLGRAAHERALALYSIEDVIRDTFLIYSVVRGE